MTNIFYKYLLIAVFPLGFFGCSKKNGPEVRPPIEVTAFIVDPQTIPADFEFVGVAKSSHPVEIRSRVEGYLWSIDYTEGSAVEENDLLFQIDPRPFEASLEEAKGELARQEAILWRAQRALERIQPLYEKNAVSLRDLDDATAAVLTAQADVISAKGNLINAELNLSFTRITSPINGLSARAAYREGTLITPSINGLLTLVSVIDPIWVDFSVSDNELLMAQGETAKNQLILPKQQEYTVSLKLADNSIFPYCGKVNFSSPTLDPDTGAMVIRATFPNPQGIILPGQFVKAIISGAYRPNAFFVPQESVFQGQKGTYVFVINKDGTVSARNVEVGEWYENFWIIKQGLSKGEMVVANGINKVSEGSHVKIISISTPPPSKIRPGTQP
jgi:membrane fusion protein, multidrug efflux system